MLDFVTLNNDLNETTKAIAEKDNEVQSTREEWLKKKAEYENAYSRALLESKIKEPGMTQSEIKAQATCLTYQLKLDCIVAESKFRQLAGELSALRDKLEALKEVSYNLRQEARLTI